MLSQVKIINAEKENLESEAIQEDEQNTDKNS
jgi:hypothetical protein